jgi:hypothetical protein
MPATAKRSRARLLLAGLVSVALTAALAACGGDGSDSTDTEANSQDAFTNFAECMRENGVDIPDPQPGQSGFALGADAAGNIDPNDPAVQAAREKCLPELRGAIPEGERPDSSEVEDDLLAYARCMRDHGIDFPDPQVSESAGATEILAPEGVDTNSPAFESASEACQEKLPSDGTGTSTEP